MRANALAVWLSVTCACVSTGCDLATGLSDMRVVGLEAAGGGGSADSGTGGGKSSGGGTAGGGGDGGAGGAEPLGCAFLDDFNDAVIANMWQQIADPNLLIEENGELVISVPAGPGKVAASVRTVPLDATTCAVSVEILEATVDAQSFVHFELFMDSENRAGFLVIGSQLRFHHEIDTVKLVEEILYRPAQHRFLEIRHESGSFVWRTSADGQTWIERRKLQSDLATNAMRVAMGTEVLEANLGAGAYRVRFDNVIAAP